VSRLALNHSSGRYRPTGWGCPLIPIGLLTLLSPFAAQPEVGEYRAMHVAVSYLVERLMPAPESGPAKPGSGLVPADLKIGYDASTNTVMLSGKAEDIAHVRRYLKLFDVAPMRVELSLSGELPLLGYAYANAITVSNNGKWVLEEPARGLRVSITPRLNDDGYATLFIEHRFGESLVKTTARAKVGESIFLDQRGQPGTSPATYLGPPGATPPFRLRISVKGIAGADPPPRPNQV
jgi:hypothetical protein